MKHRVIYLLSIVVIIALSIGFVQASPENNMVRYHQHLEQPGEADLGECQVCHGTSRLCTHLPIIKIETGGQKIPGEKILDENDNLLGYETGNNREELIRVSVSTIEGEDKWHHADDPLSLTATAMFRYRGNSSRNFSKHNYLLKFVKDNDHFSSRDLSMLGMPADSEWALHGPFLDKSLVRNYMFMNIAADVMGDAPEVRFCEVILDGEYQGLYVLMETVSEGDARVDLTDYKAGTPVCSYIVRIGANLNPLKTIETFSHYTLRYEERKEIEVIYPSTPMQTQQVHDYISADMSEIERVLYSDNMYNRSGLYKEYIDVDSFVNYYIFEEFLGVIDMFSESTYFTKDVRGKLQIGPVWDFNNVLDNFFAPTNLEMLLFPQRGWFGQLMRDQDFVNRVIARYRELRKGVLSDDNLNAYLDQTIEWLGSAVDRNFEVWGYTFDVTDPRLTRHEYRSPTPVERREIFERYPDIAPQLIAQRIREMNPDSFKSAVEQLRTSMQIRGKWLDRNIDGLLQYCSDSKNATHINY